MSAMRTKTTKTMNKVVVETSIGHVVGKMGSISGTCPECGYFSSLFGVAVHLSKDHGWDVAHIAQSLEKVSIFENAALS